MRKILKLVFYVFLITFILSPLFVGDYGSLPRDYEENLDIENGSFLEVDGYETYYIDFYPDSEAKKTILLLHGFGGSATNWLPIMPSLVDGGYRVIAVDLKGFGLSEKDENEDYSHLSQSQFVSKFIEELELKNITLVGHSMGANIAAMYLQQNPTNVEKLIFISAAVIEEKDVDILRSNALKILDFPIIREYARVILKFALDDGRVETILSSAVYDSENLDLQEPLFLDPTLFLGWERIVTKMASVSHLNFLKEDVSDINVPVLIIWGEQDTWVPVSKGDYLHRSIEESEYHIIEDCGHLPMLEKPEKVINIFESFL